jgi:TM2 domain-containing membrane protein YozV
MNCAQHTETAAVAYCRNCGRALCELCKRDVQGIIYCESCLAARMHGTAAGAEALPSRPPEPASPGLALFLGFIPGVGAFYNGQFLKGFVQVGIFGTLIWLNNHVLGDIAGVLVAAWYFYMVFDAYITARARKYGQPIPDPLGLNAILEGKEGTFRERVEQAGERMGTRMEGAARRFEEHWQRSGAATPGQPAAPPPPPPAGVAATEPQAGAGAAPTAAQGFYAAGAEGAYSQGPQGAYYQGPEGTVYVPPRQRDHTPVGAVVLIGLGVLFLLTNLGWFSFNWVSHFWPMILIGIGLWLFIRRQGWR